MNDGSIHAALCDFESASVPRIHKKPCWQNVGARVIAPTWQQCSEEPKFWPYLCFKDDVGSENCTDPGSIDDFAEYFLRNRCIRKVEREIFADHVMFSIPEKNEVTNRYLLPNCREVRVPLMFAEKSFQGLDWGPFQREK